MNYKYGWDIDEQISKVGELSPDILRMFIVIPRCLSSPSSIDTAGCANTKKTVDDLNSQGITVIGMALFFPRWMTGMEQGAIIPQRDMTPGSQYQAFLDNYEESWRTLASYFPNVMYWETGNEPNLYPNLAGPNGRRFTFQEEADITTDLMYRSRRAIRQANPAALVFTPGLTEMGPKPGVTDKTTIGLYDPGTGFFYLRNSNTQGIADVTFVYSPASGTMIPIVGRMWESDQIITMTGIADFLDLLYANIESGSWPSTDPRDYFDGVAWHPYAVDGGGRSDP